MSRTRCLLAVIVGTLILFVWNALTQFFPWGVGAVDNLSATSGQSYVLVTSGLEVAPPGTWTTQAFDDRLGNGVSTLATDRSFSWIVAVPREGYNLTRYFALHVLTQAGVALFLVLVLWLLKPLPRGRRMASVFVIGVAAMIGTYGSMMVWWGLPAAYGLGASVNLLAGWLLLLVVVERLVFGKQAEASREQPM